jgi:hypothetical protein
MAAILPLGAMSDTYSPLHNLVGASLEAASLHRCSMGGTNSSLLDVIGTSLMMVASLHIHFSTMRPTNFSLLSIFGTSSLEGATFTFLRQRCIRAVCPTYSTLNNTLGTSLVSASLLCTAYVCAMRDTYSTLDGSIGTCFEGAFFLLRHVIRAAMRFTNSSVNSYNIIGTSPLEVTYRFNSLFCN